MVAEPRYRRTIPSALSIADTASFFVLTDDSLLFMVPPSAAADKIAAAALTEAVGTHQPGTKVTYRAVA